MSGNSKQADQIAERVEEQLFKIVSGIEPHVTFSDADELFGPTLAKYVRESNVSNLVDLVLRADVLRVTLICLYADGILSTDEARLVLKLASRLARQLSRARPKIYAAFGDLTPGSLGKFYKTYWRDSGVLGFACHETLWRGLLLCRAIEHEAIGESILNPFADCLLSLAKELVAVDGLQTGRDEAYRTLVRDLRMCLDFESSQNAEPGQNTITETEVAAILGKLPQTTVEITPPIDSDRRAKPSDKQSEFRLPEVAQPRPNCRVDATERNSSSLTECPDCGGTVSKRADQCPHCGCPLRGKAVEARLTLFRAYAEAKSARRTAIHMDGEFVGNLNVASGNTFVVEPGRHTLKFSQYGLLTGELTTMKDLAIDVPAGEHLMLEFMPYGGLLGTEFLWDLSKKLT